VPAAGSVVPVLGDGVRLSGVRAEQRDLKVLLKGLLQQIVKPKTANDKGIKEEDVLGAINAQDDNLLEKKLEELLADKRYIVLLVLLLFFTN
jgi:hypothetical protein